jgi:flavin-dependent dehydrogenase
MIYDVAIIGGGIAGLSLSIDLQRRGYAVVVIEKGNYPRHKVCGEYISMESQNYLQTICPPLAELNLPQINHFKLSSTGKKEFNTPLDLGGFGISRYLLEELLFKEAKKKGVVFILKIKATDIHFNSDKKSYTISTNGDDVTACLVCDSSGRKSNLAIKEKSNQPIDTSTNYVGVKYHIKLNRDPTLIEIHNFSGGYCGISNIEDDKTCLCYIVNSKKLNSVNNSIPELEKVFLYKNGNLKKIFSTAEFIFKEPVTISGVNFLIKKTTSDNSFFIGDAAGSLAPITGNGMSIALKSASILAGTMDHYFSSKISKQQLVNNYNSFWNKEFSTRIKLSRHFQRLSENPCLTNLSIGLFNSFPPLAKSIIKQTHGSPF